MESNLWFVPLEMIICKFETMKTMKIKFLAIFNYFILIKCYDLRKYKFFIIYFQCN